MKFFDDPSNFRIEILANCALLSALGTKGLNYRKTQHFPVVDFHTNEMKSFNACIEGASNDFLFVDKMNIQVFLFNRPLSEKVCVSATRSIQLNS